MEFFQKCASMHPMYFNALCCNFCVIMSYFCKIRSHIMYTICKYFFCSVAMEVLPLLDQAVLGFQQCQSSSTLKQSLLLQVCVCVHCVCVLCVSVCVLCVSVCVSVSMYWEYYVLDLWQYEILHF